ncbi:hypothetical protein I3843_07G013600 [Carya illinoinensis]|nr:hypothetical protein I3843_07G013600 [Carya illinoinensis]
MDQREHQLQYSNICIRLFNFLKSLASQALKIPSTLGPLPLMNHGFSRVPIPSAAQDGADSKIELEQDNASKTLEPFGDPHGRELQPVQDNNDSRMNSVKRQLEDEETLSAAAPQPKAPKKAVSFHDVVEEMSSKPKQNKKMNKTTKKSTSLEREEDPKPLRSILKVGSKLNEKSDSFVNPCGDG